jgi:hypothetical protein
MTQQADVWVLLGPHRGDNNQVLALAEALQRPFRTIEMHYRQLAYLPAICRSASISGLTPDARREIGPPWPSLVLGIGQRSAPVARFIQRQSNGQTKTVRLGDPMVSHRLFDLVITTTQYAVREADNVVRLPITITNQDSVHPNKLEDRWLQSFSHPRRLIVIGGKTSLWKFGPEIISEAADTLLRRSKLEGGSVMAVISPRTSPALALAAQVALGERAVVSGPFPRYGALLQAADEIHVTGDSVSMLSDAVASGKPVGLIELEPDAIARFVRRVGEMRGRPFRMRELGKFWDDLRTRGLVGTIEKPRSGTLDVDPIETAVAAVRAALEDRLPQPAIPLEVGLPMPEPVAL